MVSASRSSLSRHCHAVFVTNTTRREAGSHKGRKVECFEQTQFFCLFEVAAAPLLLTADTCKTLQSYVVQSLWCFLSLKKLTTLWLNWKPVWHLSVWKQLSVNIKDDMATYLTLVVKRLLWIFGPRHLCVPLAWGGITHKTDLSALCICRITSSLVDFLRHFLYCHFL